MTNHADRDLNPSPQIFCQVLEELLSDICNKYQVSNRLLLVQIIYYVKN